MKCEHAIQTSTLRYNKKTKLWDRGQHQDCVKCGCPLVLLNNYEDGTTGLWAERYVIREWP